MRLSLFAAATVAIAGCNALFDISSPEPKSAGSGAGSSSSSGSSASGASSGGGGTMSASSGAGGGGAAGSGGQGGCPAYAGDAMITATNAGDADIATVTFMAQMSVSGEYYDSEDAVEFSIGGAAAGALCDIGMHVSLAGNIQAGNAYTPVSSQTHDDPMLFHAGANAFVDVVVNFDCMPPAPEVWQSFDGAPGTVKVESIVGSTVTISVTGLHVIGVMAQGTGVGTLVLDGSAHADCFAF